MSEQVVDHAAKEHAVDAGRQQAHRRSSPHRGAAPSRGSTVPSTMAATSSMKVHEREQHGKHYSHCSVNHHVHSSVAMAALETTPTAAESERDFISKFRARQCTRNRLAQPAQTTAKVGADFRTKALFLPLPCAPHFWTQKWGWVKTVSRRVFAGGIKKGPDLLPGKAGSCVTVHISPALFRHLGTAYRCTRRHARDCHAKHIMPAGPFTTMEDSILRLDLRSCGWSWACIAKMWPRLLVHELLPVSITSQALARCFSGLPMMSSGSSASARCNSGATMRTSSILWTRTRPFRLGRSLPATQGLTSAMNWNRSDPCL